MGHAKYAFLKFVFDVAFLLEDFFFSKSYPVFFERMPKNARFFCFSFVARYLRICNKGSDSGFCVDQCAGGDFQNPG